MIKSHTQAKITITIIIINSKVHFNELIILCCAVLIAVLGNMGHRLDIVER